MSCSYKLLVKKGGFSTSDDTNNRWGIHNLSQEEVGNLQLFKTFPLKKGNPHTTLKGI